MTTTEADSLHLSLCRALSANRLVSWTIGEIGSQMKAAKNYLKLHDSPSWKSYCAEIGIPYSTFANYVRLYGVYGPDGLGIGQDRFTRIGPRKLLDMITVIQRDKSDEAWVDGSVGWTFETEEWLDKAETLSESDLRMEIKGDSANAYPGATRDLGPCPLATGRSGSEVASRLSPAQYKKLVKAAPCCVCGSIATEHTQIHSHHFPQTRNRTDADHKVIPLCMTCHQECHQDPKEFLWLYKSSIFDWFYRKIVQ